MQVHCPSPETWDIIHPCQNFKCVTIPDASMQFHAFLLDKQSQQPCAVATPFGRHECLRLLLGFLNSPLWAQAAMDESFDDTPNVGVHTGDIAVFSNDFDDCTQASAGHQNDEWFHGEFWKLKPHRCCSLNKRATCARSKQQSQHRSTSHCYHF